MQDLLQRPAAWNCEWVLEHSTCEALVPLCKRYGCGPAVDQMLSEDAVNGGTSPAAGLGMKKLDIPETDFVQRTLTDHLNTVRDIARFDPQTEATTVVNHLVYDAFGRVTSETNPAVDSLFLFTARPYDPDSQLQNNLNRWYDARVGRWLSEDPSAFESNDNNLYRYVRNSPFAAGDPSGLIPIVNEIIEQGNRRRGSRGPCDDSSHHCWTVCYATALAGLGFLLPGLVAAIAEVTAPSSDAAQDVKENHKGMLCGMPIMFYQAVATLFIKDIASALCDRCCGTKPIR